MRITTVAVAVLFIAMPLAAERPAGRLLYHYPVHENDVVRTPATKPKESRRVPPTYPADALQKRIQGDVVLELLVERDGRVSAGRVLKPLPFGLTQAAIDCVEQWRYTPAKDVRGRPVRAVTTAIVQFRLP